MSTIPPDISENDTERLREFVRVTAREVRAVGGASASTTLEMIGYIRELEHALNAAKKEIRDHKEWLWEKRHN